MRKLVLVFLILTFSGHAQEDKKGTIKVKKPSSDGITVLEPVLVVNIPLTTKDQLPGYPGGQEMLSTFIKKNIRYPEAARKAGIKGTVCISFIVKPDGSLSKIGLAKGVVGGSALNDEALRVVKMMPNWTPGKKNGTVVDVLFSLPIKFAL